ncbi:U3 small nucleolar RNA-associated protein 4 [Nowakowskiella sp. JEL0078]|nr:U3 small nucleolar RNA-associated protein 4 [Nowakowskiella sp. JEL0078]
MECHRARFVEYMPSGIHALSFSPIPSTPSTALLKHKIRLACSRENGDIEIWNPRPALNRNFFLERVWFLYSPLPTIPGGPNSSVECIVWSHQTKPDLESLMAVDNEDEAKAEFLAESIRLENLPPRLFSGGLNALIQEYDMIKLEPKQSVESNGGSVWCMAVSNSQTRLAVGCEDFCIRIFNIADGELTYMRSFLKQDGRILSISWNSTDKFIIAGCSDSCVRQYDVETGSCVLRSTLDTIAQRIGLKKKQKTIVSTLETGFLGFGTSEKDDHKKKKNKVEDTLVWALLVLADETVVTGDSLGYVIFWDMKTGTLKQSIKAHQADVLCLVANTNGTTVYSSGIDRKVVQFKTVENSRINKKWVISGEKRYHSHDVRALALCEEFPINSLISGGVDTQLTVSQPATDFPNAVYNMRIPSLPGRNIISVSKSQGLILARFEMSLKLWKMGTALQPGDLSELQDQERLDIGQPHKFLIEINLEVLTNLTASAISENGKWIAVSDLYSIKFFRISKKGIDKPYSIKKMKSFPLPNIVPPAHCLQFSPDSKRLIVAGTDLSITIIDIIDEPIISLKDFNEPSFQVVKKLWEHAGGDPESKNTGVGDLILTMTLSADGQWLATGDIKNKIYIFNMDTLKVKPFFTLKFMYLLFNMKIHAKIPQHAVPHTSLTFHPNSPTLVVTLSSNKFYFYDVENLDSSLSELKVKRRDVSVPSCRLTDWSREYSNELPEKLLGKRDAIRGVGFHPSKPEIMFLWFSKCIVRINLMKPLSVKKVVKRKFDYPIEMAEKPRTKEVGKKPEWAQNMEMIVLSDDDQDVLMEPVLKIAEKKQLQPKKKKKETVFGSDSKLGEYDMDIADDNDDAERQKNCTVRIIERFAPLIGVEFFIDGKMLVVERPQLEIVKNLPESFYRHKYGT